MAIRVAEQSRSPEIIRENRYDLREIKKPSAKTEGCMVFCSNGKKANAEMNVEIMLLLLFPLFFFLLQKGFFFSYG